MPTLMPIFANRMSLTWSAEVRFPTGQKAGLSTKEIT
jgi:hypothetical protein